MNAIENATLGLLGLQIEDAMDAYLIAKRAEDEVPAYKRPQAVAERAKCEAVHTALCNAYDAIEKELKKVARAEKREAAKELLAENRALEDRVKSQAESLEFSHETKMNALNMLNVTLDERNAARAEIVNLKAQVMILENNINDITNEKVASEIKAQEIILKKDSRYDAKKAECEALREDIKVYRDAVSDLDKLLKDCDNNNTGLIEDNQEYREENLKFGDELRQKEVEIESLKSKCDYLQSTIDAIVTPSKKVHPDQLELPL